MRVALCLAGQPRQLAKCWPRMKKYIVEPNNADVFMHAWTTHPKKSTGWFHDDDVRWDVLSEFEMLDLVKPKSCLFESQIEWDISPYPKTHASTFTVMSFLYSLSIAHKLYDPKDYDYVLHARMDLFFHNEVLLQNLESNTIYIEYRETSGDQFAYGCSHEMQKFSEVFDNFDALYKQVGHVHNETFIETHIRNCGFKNKPAVKPYAIAGMRGWR